MDFDSFELNKVTGYEWDEGNIEKNKRKHNLDKWQIEEVFFNEPLLIYEDSKHSNSEFRWFALGKTDNELKLMIVFTVRKNLIRVISARTMSKKERMYYENV
ncbi:MAG: BrnT family toxin [Bacteroidota bacterium]|nr:BrnT family toxin [Bacteroidota bacterium]